MGLFVNLRGVAEAYKCEQRIAAMFGILIVQLSLNPPSKVHGKGLGTLRFGFEPFGIQSLASPVI